MPGAPIVASLLLVVRPGALFIASCSWSQWMRMPSKSNTSKITCTTLLRVRVASLLLLESRLQAFTLVPVRVIRQSGYEWMSTSEALHSPALGTGTGGLLEGIYSKRYTTQCSKTCKDFPQRDLSSEVFLSFPSLPNFFSRFHSFQSFWGEATTAVS